MKQPSPSPAPPPGDALKARLVIGIIFVGLVSIYLYQYSGPSSTETPTPTYTYRAAAQELVRQRLREPSSAEFTGIEVIAGAPGRATIVCGRVNARNGFGGMTGAKRFVVGGTVALEADVGTVDMDQLWARFC